MTKKKVGYKSPPGHTRFKKGVSGNPSGRPKRDTSYMPLNRAVRECLLEDITVKRKGRPMKMTRLESLVQKLFVDAMNSSMPAARLLLGLAQDHIPPNQTLEEIRGHRPVYEFTKEERDAMLKLLEGVELGKPSGGE
jgi:hypothetical protein